MSHRIIFVPFQKRQGEALPFTLTYLGAAACMLTEHLNVLIQPQCSDGQMVYLVCFWMLVKEILSCPYSPQHSKFLLTTVPDVWRGQMPYSWWKASECPDYYTQTIGAKELVDGGLYDDSHGTHWKGGDTGGPGQTNSFLLILNTRHLSQCDILHCVY